MSNEEYLLKLYNSYPNAHYFTLINHNFRLEINDKTWEIPLNDLKLEELNSNIFLLHPLETFKIIYMIVLIYKVNLTDSEQEFVKRYTQEYINVSDKYLSEGYEDINRSYCLSIPIYTAYNENVINLPASSLIQDILNNHSKEIESGQGKGYALTLKNPNGSYIPDENPINDYRQAGFITLALIVGAVAITIAYITTFMLNS